MERELAKSKKALALAKQFEKSQPPWPIIENTIAERISKDSRFSSGSLMGLLGEACLKLFLHEAKVAVPGIKDGVGAGDYKFNKTYRRLIISQRVGHVWQEVTDIDALTNIQRKIFLWECKLNRSGQQLGKHGNRMLLDNVDRVVEPLRRHFRLPVGYVMVVAQGMILENSPVQDKFTEAGGIIAEFPASSEEMRTRAVDLAQRFNLPIDPSMLISP